jgi:transcriptional regulator with XRE-family HTH domain
MGRAALGWGVRELAEAAGVSANTIARFEGGKKANTATLKVIRQAFEAAGVRFNDQGGVDPPERASE